MNQIQTTKRKTEKTSEKTTKKKKKDRTKNKKTQKKKKDKKQTWTSYSSQKVGAFSTGTAFIIQKSGC